MSNASVGIVYHFFAHYRDPVLKELSTSTEYDYWFVGDKDDPNKKEIPGAGIINHPHFVYAPCRFWRQFLLQRGLIRFAFRKDIDAIIYLGEPHFISTWISAMLARLTGKRIYFWTHGWTHSDSWIKGIIRCSFYRLANGGLMLYGYRARQIGIMKGFNPKHLYVIYNSLDYEHSRCIREDVTSSEIDAVRQENFVNPSLPIVICTSRLTKARRLELLLDALKLLKSRGYEVNALIVGGGPEKDVLEQKANNMDLPVRFLGECYDEKILARLFMASHVTVVPGNVGLTAVHSLGYGTPVIADDNPEVNGPEWEAIQPKWNGDLFKSGDAADLADKIYCLTQLNSVEKEELKARCINSIEQHYTPKAQRQAIEYALSGKPAVSESAK